MKKILKNKKGIIGVDYICVAGVVITLTSYILTNFYTSGMFISDKYLSQLDTVLNVVNIEDKDYLYEGALLAVNKADKEKTHENIVIAQTAIDNLSDTTEKTELNKKLNVIKAKTYIPGIDSFLEDNYYYGIYGTLSEAKDIGLEIPDNANYEDVFTVTRIVDNKEPTLITNVTLYKESEEAPNGLSTTGPYKFEKYIKYNLYNKDMTLISTYTITK